VSRFPAVAAVLVAVTATNAKVLLSQDEALKLAFPKATVERKTAYLTIAQQREAQKMSGDDDLPSALVAFYVATSDGHEVGTAYFDSHIVRTLPETIMVVVDAEGRASRVEVLSFQEPEEFLPKPRWYEQFRAKALNDELSMKRGIRSVSGATLTARATTDAVRRVLALHHVIRHAAPAPGRAP